MLLISRRPQFFKVITVLALILACMIPTANAERVKDLVNVAGVRENQLVGYGLVVGLSGTGDQTSQAPFTIQSIRNMLTGFGVRVPDNVNPQLKNVAAVTVHASLSGRVSAMDSYLLVMPLACAVVVY